MTVEVCGVCRGSGVDPWERRVFMLCRVCGGSGYPVGYTPPTREQVLAWLRSFVN